MDVSCFDYHFNLQTFRAYRFRKRSRNVSEASEEAYLRDDIPCGSEACSTCSNGLPALSADASHYVIPDSQALDDYLEVFELPQLKNFVLLTSVLQKVWLIIKGTMTSTQHT